LADRHPWLPLFDGAEDVRRLGLAPAVPGLVDPADLFGLYPPQAERVAGVPEDEGRRQGLEQAADRQLPALSEQQVRAAGVARRTCRSRRDLVYGPVLRAVLPHHHAEGRLRHSVSAHSGIAYSRHAVLHLLRLAVRSDRATENHPRRLRTWRGDVLPAVR